MRERLASSKSNGKKIEIAQINLMVASIEFARCLVPQIMYPKLQIKFRPKMKMQIKFLVLNGYFWMHGSQLRPIIRKYSRIDSEICIFDCFISILKVERELSVFQRYQNKISIITEQTAFISYSYQFNSFSFMAIIIRVSSNEILMRKRCLIF